MTGSAPSSPSSTPAATRKRRGALISIEGLDRAGKSTQCALLVSRLERARLQKFPDRTSPTGRVINAFLTSTTGPAEPHCVHLLFSANRWEALPTLLAALDAGETIVMDRYVHSGIAFSAARGLDYAYCRAPDLGLPRPDLTVFLDLDPGVAAAREGFGAERYELPELQEKVRKVFLRMKEEEKDAWVAVDARRSVDEVAEEVWAAVQVAVEWAAENDLRRFE